MTKKIQVLVFIFSLFAGLAIQSCNKCDDADPRARILNNGTKKASVQVKTSGGNTININNVDPGAASAYGSYAPGEITFTISVDNQDYQTTVNAEVCTDYDIAIDGNNQITIAESEQ